MGFCHGVVRGGLSRAHGFGRLLLGRSPCFYPLLSFSGECLLFGLWRVCVRFFSANPGVLGDGLLPARPPLPHFELFHHDKKSAGEACLDK